ncbi:sensor histidine kinase [Embleya scabrispora]|uniref:sensor histidine kinase n=1 Tax=Embleya scabrispora TaxID=159449 RepID=UPI00036EB97A|nr:sensor histidine kinase [Embleya scabrispora]MYS82019.1 two-component sensor histidine kinase [Streptomyces sp. SID5474]
MTKSLTTVARAWVRRPAVRDAALASALLALYLVLGSPDGVVHDQTGDGDGSSTPEVAVWWTATALAVTGVALRRRWPLPMLAACIASAGINLTLTLPSAFVDLGVPILLCTVANRYDRKLSMGVLVGLLTLATGLSVYNVVDDRPSPGFGTQPPPSAPSLRVTGPDGPQMASRRMTWTGNVSGLYVMGSVLVGAWAIGAGARSRRAYLAELHERADGLERERDQKAALAAAAERARISRELHDVVAHGLSVMVIQAQGAAVALDKRPAQTRTALEAIVATGRDSLADMRRVLDAVGEGVDDAWGPPLGLAQLPDLVGKVNRAGTHVSLAVRGAPVTLPATVDASAYRIVQEALTNTIKHAGPRAHADVVLSYHSGAVTIEVSDNGRSTVRDDGQGNGLRGMRERARTLGGGFTAGPGPDGGFTVRATLPIEGRAA